MKRKGLKGKKINLAEGKQGKGVLLNGGILGWIKKSLGVFGRKRCTSSVSPMGPIFLRILRMEIFS